MPGSHFRGQSKRKTLGKKFSITVQITFTFKLRSVAYVDTFGSKNCAPVIVLIEHLIQPFDIANPLLCESRRLVQSVVHSRLRPG